MSMSKFKTVFTTDTVIRILLLEALGNGPGPRLYLFLFQEFIGGVMKARGRSLNVDIPRSRAVAGRKVENQTAIFMDSFTTGALLGAAALVLTTPFGVGKTRQHVFKDRASYTKGGSESPGGI
jgi:hypothetical protein